MLLSKNNTRVKYLRRLSRRKFRDEQGKFVIEGVRFVEEAVKVNWPLEMALYIPKLADSLRGAKLLAELARQNVPLGMIDDKLCLELADTKTPQGILAVAYAHGHGVQKYDLNYWNQPRHHLLILVDGIQDPGNLGTIIRSAGAAGAQGLFVTKGSVDPYNPKTLRSTMGSIFHVPIVPDFNWEQFLDMLKNGGWQLVAGDLSATRMLYQVDLTGRVVLAVGSEANGISDMVRRHVDQPVRIPMPGYAESLNAGVALGIMLYEVVRQRMYHHV